jgi:hypothetical protein
LGDTDNVKFEMGSGAMIYIPTFIKTDSDIQKLIGGIHTDTPSNVKVLSQKFERLQYRYN